MSTNDVMICVLGRGIEKNKNVWQPTGIVEKQVNGDHSGVLVEDLDANSDDPDVVIAGGRLNCLAATHLYNQLSDPYPPRVVTFAAGRPNYLAKEPPDLTEGEVMLKRFIKQTCLKKGTEIILQTKNKNSRDDIRETLLLAREKKCSQLYFVTMLVHIARCQVFLNSMTTLCVPEVNFLASEVILMESSDSHREILPPFLISKAYSRTAERERQGIEAFKNGRYQSIQK